MLLPADSSGVKKAFDWPGTLLYMLVWNIVINYFFCNYLGTFGPKLVLMELSCITILLSFFTISRCRIIWYWFEGAEGDSERKCAAWGSSTDCFKNWEEDQLLGGRSSSSIWREACWSCGCCLSVFTLCLLCLRV